MDAGLLRIYTELCTIYILDSFHVANMLIIIFILVSIHISYIYLVKMTCK